MTTQKRLHELFYYNPDTGIFIRKVQSANRTKKGEIAGSINKKGYRCMKVDNGKYQAHRLAWLFVHGEWPNDQIDHINGDKQDNRICNLRVVNNSENQQNAIKAHVNNVTKMRGVRYYKNPRNIRKYGAVISINGKRIYLGSFHSPEEAYDVYLSAKLKLHIRGVV